jgi:hypothetical protein
MNRNLVGSIYMYGRLCIKFPQSRMKGERHRLSSSSNSQISIKFSNLMSFFKFSNLWPFLTFSNRHPMMSLTYTLTNKFIIDMRIWRGRWFENTFKSDWFEIMTSLNADLRGERQFEYHIYLLNTVKPI